MDEIRIKSTQQIIISFCKLAQEALSVMGRIIGNSKADGAQMLTIRQVGDLICLGIAVPRGKGFITVVELPVGVLEEGVDEL